MTRLQELKSRVDRVCGKHDNILSTKNKLVSEIYNAKCKLDMIESATDFLIYFSEENRRKMKERIESLANSALKIIFPNKTIVFKLIPQKTSKNIVYNTYTDTNGVIEPLLDSKGGGVKDIISICIRISYLRMLKSKLRQILILDEPFKNIDAIRLNIALEWLRKISKEMGIQFIIVTHITALIKLSDKHFNFVLKNGVTKIEQKNIKT